MKRTNLVLNEDLLEEAVKTLGVKTYSEAVNVALRETVRLARAKEILGFIGSGAWQGDLAEMRKDSPPPKTRRRKK